MHERQSYICIPITESEPGRFLTAFGEASEAADLIELRVDYLDLDTAGIFKFLDELVLKSTALLLLTFRPSEQGGMRQLSLGDRRQFWDHLPQAVIDRLTYADFEFDLVESYGGAGRPPVPWEKVICSWHDFEETPGDLQSRFARMAATPAAVVKIVTKANRITDCVEIFRIIESARKPVIALAMGMPGLMTRVLALSRGAMLTFGSLRRGAESAPGQPTAEELRNLYRVRELSLESEIYGVIGKPIGHSRSPLMHNAALRAAGRDGVYLPFEVDDIDRFVEDLVRPATRKLDWNLRGMSVTIPHKLSIMKHLDFIDEAARRIGAVNTVIIKGGELHGYNTDVIGAMRPLDDLIDVKDAMVAVIGAGGSARAICYGLSERGANVTVFARDVRKAETLAAEFKARAASLDSFSGSADLVINCTPIGMHGHSQGQSPIPAQSLKNVKLVYDLIYNPEETSLLKDARRAGCRTLGGLAMLTGQASEQFRLWTGRGFKT